MITWPHYSSVWRWHFYAGLVCIPFVCWLAVTGSIYLFRSDYEAWHDRPIERLEYMGSRQAPAAEARAALAALPGSTFSRYEPPATARGAAQIVVQFRGQLYRVAVHPRTLAPLRIEADSGRLMERVFALHGSLGVGDAGSYVMETAASWTIVMIVSGFFLWFPRNAKGVWGILLPRLGSSGRAWWRDLHAVTGVWISLIVLIMLLTGLPWASGWGRYFIWARNLTTATAAPPDWPITKRPLGGGTASSAADLESGPTGSADAQSSMPGMTAAEMAAMPSAGMSKGAMSGPPRPAGAQSSMPGMTAAEMAAMPSAGMSNMANGLTTASWTLSDLNVVVPAVEAQHLSRPVWILPPSKPGDRWVGASQAQDRTRRREVKVDATTGRIVESSSFEDLPFLDKIVNVGIAWHEGHLFGRANQAMLLTAAVALLGMCVSAIAMWWRRRPSGRLGAPRGRAERQVIIGLLATVCLLAVLFPMFGASLAVVLLLERVVLVRIPRVSEWLGLRVRSAE